MYRNMSNVKAWLHEWLAKQKKNPSFDIRPGTGMYLFLSIHYTLPFVESDQSETVKFYINLKYTSIGRQRGFTCQLRVTDIPYIGIGTSSSKKDAQANAAYDFCQFLLRE